MADMRIDLKKLGEIGEHLEDKDALRKIHSYLYQLAEQLRYFQNHIEPENLTQKANEEYELLIKRSRMTLEATEELILQVQALSEKTPEGVENNTIRIDNTGIELTAGEIYMLSGLLKLIANDAGSMIQFGSGADGIPSLILGNGGDVNARTGEFREGLTVAGQNITSLIADVIEQQKNSASGLDYKIIVSDTQPDGDRILWFQPEQNVPQPAGEVTCEYSDTAKRSFPMIPANGGRTWYRMAKTGQAIGSQDGCTLRFECTLVLSASYASHCSLIVMVRYNEGTTQAVKAVYAQNWTEDGQYVGGAVAINTEIELQTDPTDSDYIEYCVDFRQTGTETYSINPSFVSYGGAKATFFTELEPVQEETHVANCQVKFIWKEAAET